MLCLLLIITINLRSFNMNKLKKIGLSALAGSLVAVSAHAGEMSVSGTAWVGIGNTDQDKGAGFTSMTDSLTFTGTGELDNGMNVTLKYELDGDTTAGTSADDQMFDSHSLAISGGFGKITYSGHGTGGALDSMDDKTPNAYEEAWDAGNSAADDTLVSKGNSIDDSFRYDSPSIGGAVFTAYYADDSASSSIFSTYMDFGVTLKPEMVEGLEIGLATGEKDTSATETIERDTQYIKYAYGPVTVGYQVAESSSNEASATVSEGFETTAYSATFAVSDSMSIGYGVFEADYDDTTKKDQESTAITASYTMGGMTIGGLIGEDENIKGEDANDNDKYELSISFAF